MNYRRFFAAGGVNPFLQMVVFILAIGLLGVLGYRQLDRVLAPRRTVVVLADTLKSGSVISEEHLTLSSLRESKLSAAVMEDPGQAVGRTLGRKKRAGEPIYPSDFATVVAGKRAALAEIVPEGRVITTLMLTNRTIPYRELKHGDRVDILAAGQSKEGGRSSAVIVRDAYVLGYLSPPVSRKPARRGLLGIAGVGSEKTKTTPPGLMLAVYPTDVLPLAEIDGSGLHLNLVLHNKQTVADGNMLTVKRHNSPRLVDVIQGDQRDSVKVVQ